jgi:hypothetical protein
MYNDVHIGSIGIDYKGTPNQLGGCIADAVSWQKWGQQIGAKRTLDRIEGDATFDGITSMVLDLFGGMKPGDLAIITRSGHGTQVPDRSNDEADGLDEAFVPYDYRTKLYLDDQYRALLQRRPAGTYVALIDDFCHSGTAARAFSKHPAEIPGMPRFVPFHNLEDEMCAATVTKLCKRPRVKARGPLDVDEGIIQITGCKDTEYSYDAAFQTGPNGAATYHLLRSWRQLPAGSTFAQWYSALTPVYLPSKKFPQSPQFNASAALQAWFAPGLKPPPAPVVVSPSPPASPGVGTLTLGGKTYEVREVG